MKRTNYWEGMISMSIAVKNDCQGALNEQKKESRSLVMVGLEQFKNGKTKDFNEVCDRLGTKYKK